MLLASFLHFRVPAIGMESSGLHSVLDTLGQSSRGAWGEDVSPENIPTGGMQLGTESSQPGSGRTEDSIFQHVPGNHRGQIISSPPGNVTFCFPLCKARLAEM